MMMMITTRESSNSSGESSAGYFRTASGRATYGDQTVRTTLSSAPFAFQYNCLAPRTREASSQPHTVLRYVATYLFVNAYLHRHECAYVHVLSKVTPVHAMEAYGEVEVCLQLFVASARSGVTGQILCTMLCMYIFVRGQGYCSPHCDSLRAGRTGDRIPVGARFSAPIQTDPGAHPASYTVDIGSVSRALSGRGVALTTHPHLAPRLKKE
jgi:hypothetical protein